MDDRTPAAWLQLLEPRLNEQARRCRVYRDYYDGNHPLSFETAKFRKTFGALFSEFADNWLQIVVDAPVERLGVMGFRFGADDADDEAWGFWQASGMDADIIKGFTESVKCGRSYLMTAPTADGPRISVESPDQVVVACSSEDRRVRLAALKRWRSDDGYWYATLYLPDVIVKWRSAERLGSTAVGRVQWTSRQDDPGGANPLGVVPVVPLENNPDLLHGGTSDMDPGIPLNRAINKLCSDLMVGSESASFPQRWATGLEIPIDPNTGQPDKNAMLKASQSELWASANENATFGSLGVGDVNQHVGPIEMFVQHMAAQTRTPPHYLLSKMANLSGDALKAAETGLVARVKRKQIDFSDSLEETLRMCFKINGDTAKSRIFDAETIWRDPESRSPGVIADSLVKKAQIGVPLEILWEEAGYSPAQIKRMVKLKGLPDRAPVDDFASVNAEAMPPV